MVQCVYSTTVEDGINRKPSYRVEVIAAYCSNFGHFAFLSHPLLA